MEALPWLTFRRFFELFAAASGLVVEDGLFLLGELLLGAVISEAFLLWLISRGSVMSTVVAPSGLRAASVIKRRGIDRFQSWILFLDMRN